jgi:hypothetical protein
LAFSIDTVKTVCYPDLLRKHFYSSGSGQHKSGNLGNRIIPAKGKTADMISRNYQVSDINERIRVVAVVIDKPGLS